MKTKAVHYAAFHNLPYYLSLCPTGGYRLPCVGTAKYPRVTTAREEVTCRRCQYYLRRYQRQAPGRAQGLPTRERCVTSGLGAPDDAEYRRQARGMYQCDGAIEIDDNATVSRSDGGAYVAAWVWVADPQPAVVSGGDL